MVTLVEAQEFLNTIPNIHNGGCGYSALALYEVLQQNGDAKHAQFVYVYASWEEDRYENNSNVLKYRKGVPEAPMHVCLYYKGHFIDCTGVIDENVEEEGNKLHYIKRKQFVKDTLKNKETWNDMFSRYGNLKRIKETLGVKL